jgi:hypothetical protein
MNPSPAIHHHRGSDLLSRVHEDVTFLRKDLENLFTHTARHSVPDRIHGMTAAAEQRIAEGTHAAAQRLHGVGTALRRQPPAVLLGGAALMGLFAAGSWLLLRHNGREHQS